MASLALIGLVIAGSRPVLAQRYAAPRPYAGPSCQYHATPAAYLQPVVPAEGSAPASETKVYACPIDQAEAVAVGLRRQFPSAQIAVAARTGQIVVQAPAAVQTEIARAVAVATSAAQPTPAAGSPNQGPSAPSSAAKALNLVLRHLASEQLEGALAGALGNRLTAGPLAGNYRLALPDGQAIQITFRGAGNQLTVQGAGGAVDALVRLVQMLDQPRQAANRSTRLVGLRRASPTSVNQAVDAMVAAGETAGPKLPLMARMFQPQDNDPLAPQPNGQFPGVAPPDGQVPGAEPTEPATGDAGGAAQPGLIGPVQIELLDGLDVLVIRGHRRDVDQVMQVIDQIERLSAVTEPTVRIQHLNHVDCVALAELITPLYEEVFLPRQGSLTITALVKPNALLLIGRPENVQTAVDLVKQLDRPVAPESQFRVFRLSHSSAVTAQTMVQEFYAERGGLGPRVVAAADFRSNSLVVHASPRDLAEIARLIERLDTPTSKSVNELKVFQLENSLSEELAPIIQGAITAQGAGAAPGGGQQGAAASADQRSAMLRLLTIDAQGQRKLESGILTDVRITADTRANALVVSAPAESMPLIEALIRQLDQLPAAEAQIKVFTIVNGDAVSMVDMLDSLFGETTAAEGPAVRTGTAEGESSLVALRFAVDSRTNSIIASGSRGQLQVVEAILLRLDESDVRNRRSAVYRLKNSPAADVAAAINEYLRSERQVQQITPGILSPFEQIEREVVVVPEPVSNSLIVSATPRYFEEITGLVEELDERPPMVMIQVVIAEVDLNNLDEFGVELGLQDSVLFDRSLLSNLLTTTNTAQQSTDQGIVTATEEIIQSADNLPGYLFNNQPLGNSGSSKSLLNSARVGGQALSHFAVGRIDSELGYGGLVLSASSESVSVLVRALKQCRRLDVLSRPEVMTLDNQPAFIQVGERVPTIRGTSTNQTGQTNQIEFENVGLILGVTPRISPDGLVVMEIDAEKSEVGPIDEGIPVSISATGEVIKSPRIETTTAQTTVSALSGQTVILAGLIKKGKAKVTRRVPLLGSIPILGNLFRYDGYNEEREELLIIMTPHIIDSEEDSEKLKQEEAARMHWCLSDVLEMIDDPTLKGRSGDWTDSEVEVIYPDHVEGEIVMPNENGMVPNGGPRAPETIPMPPSEPIHPTMAPMPSENPFRPETGHGVPAIPTAPNPPSPVLPEPTPAAGAGSHEPRPMPTGSQLNLRPVEQAGYRPATGPGGVAPAVYQPPSYPSTPPPYQHQPRYQPASSSGVAPAVYQQPGYAPPSYPQPWPSQGSATVAPGYQPPNRPTY